MLTSVTTQKLIDLGCPTMAEGLADQLANPGGFADLAFEDRLGLLVDREADARDSRRLKMRLRVAKLRYPASVEDLDLRAPRGLDRSLVMELATGSWVPRHHNLVLTGPTGVGKSYIACALAQAAIRAGHSAYDVRAPRLADDLAVGRADGRYGRLLAHLARTEDRAQRRSTMVVSQLPVDSWHPAMADPTLGEAILDRLLQASHRITLTGRSMRRRDPEPDPGGGA